MAFIPTEEHLKAPQLNERVDYDVIDKQLADGIDCIDNLDTLI